MKTPSLLFIADRGKLLTYAPNASAEKPTLDLVDRVDLPEGKDRLGEQVTDRAGAFPIAGDGSATSAAERMTLTAELEMRTFRDIAERIITLVEQRHPESWAFAAPSEINRAILDGLPAQTKQTLVQNLPLDLTNTPSGQLLDHFHKYDR